MRRAVMMCATLWLTGCLGEGRPLEDYIRYEESKRSDAGPGAPVGEVDVDPPVCSMGGAPVVLFFVNNSERDVDVLWIDRACNEVRYRTLAPGASYNQPTYSDDTWRLRDAGSQVVLLDYLGFTQTGENEVAYP